jgi:hypothetical protein
VGERRLNGDKGFIGTGTSGGGVSSVLDGIIYVQNK